ncbi:XRE family transcriptional regulator [Thioalkalivibrio versutus]|uniref:XRE family transcriptional regulator n=1 Tax=Thioalkalivibrio versutus TaxID=106634 RepID=A0A0G3G1T2_9GAMM|nr:MULTISPECIES: MbcA/ParS/Xre antitoxin family protein [Thioalkalivibrio]AKJ94354.1 XRE family transcriptional regulator [Thioalkalivibrio versutus]
MSATEGLAAERADVLREALVNAGKALGLTQAELGEVIGRGRTDISRGNVDPASKPGELALLLIRCYRALYVLTGGDASAMKHWMQTHNHHIGGVPAEQIRTVQGLVGVLEYLDAIRGKL